MGKKITYEEYLESRRNKNKKSKLQEWLDALFVVGFFTLIFGFAIGLKVLVIKSSKEDCISKGGTIVEKNGVFVGCVYKGDK